MLVRVVLDTNVIIAGLMSKTGASNRVLQLSSDGQFEYALSDALGYEYEEVLYRMFSRLTLNETQISLFLAFMAQKAYVQPLYFRWRPQLKDPKDEHVLELAINARAVYIVTFNRKDFVGSERFGVKVISPAEFLNLLEPPVIPIKGE